ncbi:MAG: hypothetical protein GWO02_11650, partial [Gammaproteobacteria bacterium]|nr:hypothetical protein [Gammaproteobacteria bacterium]
MTERAVAGRAFANFSTPAALGGFLALVLPVTLERAVASAGRRRVLWAAAVVAQLVALFASASLTATAALIGAV